MGFLNNTFGEAGTAAVYFGGNWWLVGLLVILLFALYIFGKGVTGEGIAIFLFAAILFVTIDDLFKISQDIIMTVVIMIIIFVAFFFYLLVGK